jgi:hypothetical protein
MMKSVMKMKRFLLCLLAAALAAMCFGCALPEETDAALIGSPIREVCTSATFKEKNLYAWKDAEGCTVVVGSDDDTTVRSVVRFSKEGKVAEQIGAAVLTDADPAQWPGMTTQDLYMQIGEPPYDHGFGLYDRQIVSYLTEEGKICCLYLLDGCVSHVLVRDLFSDQKELYPSGRSHVEDGETVTMVCRVYENDAELLLPEAEASQVISILNGKKRYSEIPAETMCGFYDKLAFRVGDRTFCPGFDGCCIVMEYDTGLLFDISKEERDTLDAIFAAHGLQYP